MIDTTMNMNSQAYALMHFLSTQEPHTARYQDGKYQIDIRCKPYINGRERGFVLEIRQGIGRDPVCLAFFEHRNSDALCCIKWVTDWPVECYRADNIPHDVYPDKWSVTKSWPSMDFTGAYEYVLDVIAEVSATDEVAA
jgi:hypothetical protein